jgi:hypothetical protein
MVVTMHGPSALKTVVFKDFQNVFSTLYHYKLFIYFFEITYKMLTETLLRIPFSVIGRCSPVSTPHWL